jgi:uncharacterized protein
MNFQEPLSGILERIASALERLGPGRPGRPDFAAAEAFVWQPESGGFEPITDVNRVKLSLLKGIDRMRDTRCSPTRSVSRKAFPPTTRCCGARAAWARAR